MIRLLLTIIMCSLNTYSVSTLGSDGYNYKASCTFSSTQILDLYNEYKYNDTVLTKKDPLKMEYTLTVYADIYYTDINFYRVNVKTIHLSNYTLYYYDSSNNEWLSEIDTESTQIITFGNGNGYSWTNNTSPYNICLFSSVDDTDPLNIYTTACYYYNGSIITTDITNNGYSPEFGQFYALYPSMTYLYTYTDYDLYKTFYQLDYNMFYDTLRLLVGTDSNFNDGYSIGYNAGYDEGNSTGYSTGYESGYSSGKEVGHSEGYSEGYHDAEDADAQAAAIYAGIIATGMIPIQFFLSIFNFEVFGINLTGLVTSLMSICIVLIVIKRTFAIHEDS